MSILPAVVLAFLSWWFPGTGQSEDLQRTIEVGIEPNVETAMILFGLASENTNRLFSGQITPLLHESRTHFSPFRDHPSVEVARDMERHGWLAGMVELAVRSSTVPEAQLLSPLSDALSEGFSGSGDPDEGRSRVNRFLAALNEFYRDADVASFLARHQGLYEEVVREVRENLPPPEFIPAMEAFYGEKKATFRLVPSPLMYRGVGFGPRVYLPEGMVILNVFGPLLETEALATTGFGFDDPDGIQELSTHEFGHSFINPIVEDPDLQSSVAGLEYLLAPIRETMAGLGYRSWDVVLKEHLVRLGEIRIALAMGDAERAARLRSYHVHDRGFTYLPILEEAVGAFEEDRESFPTFREFLPFLLGEMARSSPNTQSILFTDSFEGDLSRWLVLGPEAISIIDSGDPSHGGVLQMNPAGEGTLALMEGSETWRGYRIEGEFLFPERVHNYLGLVYDYTDQGGRVDFGSMYLKGNGSYIRVNPRRDWNPGRALYEEMRTPVSGRDSVLIGEWGRFAAEVIGTVCHFYVGDLTTPKITFELPDLASGPGGLKPRVVGGAVWVDNVRVEGLEGFSYQGPSLPREVDYRPDLLVTDWEVLGPLPRTLEALEFANPPYGDIFLAGEGEHPWRNFQVDQRGGVLTGTVVDFHGPNTVAYFRTDITVPEGVEARLEFSSVDDMSLWRNGAFQGYRYAEDLAWHDFGRNPERPVAGWSLPLLPGMNHILIRVRGGRYASGGFFARVVEEG